MGCVIARHVTDEDVQALERRLMQTMDMIVSKKKRIAIAKKQSLRNATVNQVRGALRWLIQWCRLVAAGVVCDELCV